jgi:hypothetical protein
MTYETYGKDEVYVFNDITPGTYTLNHTFGVGIWGPQILTEEQLIGTGTQPTVTALNLTQFGIGSTRWGTVEVRVYPGETSGRIEVTFKYDTAPEAGITTVPYVDIDGAGKVSYQVNLGQVENANVFEVSAKFDASKLSYAGYDLALPNAAAVSDAKYNEVTGQFTLTFVLAGAGLTYTSEASAPVLTVNFALRDSVKLGDTVEATLASFKVTTTDGTTAVTQEANLDPSVAAFTAANSLRYDTDKDGLITVRDISLIIYNHYLSRKGQLGWNAAQYYDANGDGIIDLVDIIIISTYIK